MRLNVLRVGLASYVGVIVTAQLRGRAGGGSDAHGTKRRLEAEVTVQGSVAGGDTAGEPCQASSVTKIEGAQAAQDAVTTVDIWRQMQLPLADAFTEYMTSPQKKGQPPYYPLCTLSDPVINSSHGCTFLEAWRTVQTHVFSNISTTFSSKAPIDLEGALPQDIVDLRPVPFEVPKSVSSKERPTYYFCFRLITNLYHMATVATWEGVSGPWDMKAGNGWELTKVVLLNEDMYNNTAFKVTPAAAVLYNVRRGIAVVVIRGTLSREEWSMDFLYSYAEGDAQQTFPGSVHKGVHNLYSRIIPEVLSEMWRLRPQRIVVTGHSLGGALCGLVSYKLAVELPAVRVDGIAFAGITVGDPEFTSALTEKVNYRHIFFLGPGWDGKYFRAGDPVPQFTCGPFPGCPDINTGPCKARYQYGYTGAFVPFYAEDLPNTESWKGKETLLIPMYPFIVASHVCSYMCWTTHGFDDDYRCYFQHDSDAASRPEWQICQIYSPFTQTARLPNTDPMK